MELLQFDPPEVHVIVDLLHFNSSVYFSMMRSTHFSTDTELEQMEASVELWRNLSPECNM